MLAVMDALARRHQRNHRSLPPLLQPQPSYHSLSPPATCFMMVSGAGPIAMTVTEPGSTSVLPASAVWCVATPVGRKPGNQKRWKAWSVSRKMARDDGSMSNARRMSGGTRAFQTVCQTCPSCMQTHVITGPTLPCNGKGATPQTADDDARDYGGNAEAPCCRLNASFELLVRHNGHKDDSRTCSSAGRLQAPHLAEG